MATKAEKGRVSIMTKQQKKTLKLVLTYLGHHPDWLRVAVPHCMDDFGRVQNQR